ncbi:MAG: hypothetical protein LBM07_02220 [Culturomica sp.]|jgi:hypothetical protein|nr:hypothetical protein [Culturomica sp.]
MSETTNNKITFYNTYSVDEYLKELKKVNELTTGKDLPLSDDELSLIENDEIREAIKTRKSLDEKRYES